MSRRECYYVNSLPQIGTDWSINIRAKVFILSLGPHPVLRTSKEQWELMLVGKKWPHG